MPEKTSKVEVLTERFARSKPTEEERAAIMQELEAARLNRDEMIDLAYSVLKVRCQSKKAALHAITSWYWHRVRARTSAEQMTRGGAR